MSKPTTKSSTGAVAGQVAAPALSLGTELESLLDGFTEQHLALLVHTEAHRGAIRRADGAGVQAAAEAQTRVVAVLGRLEQRRREVVAWGCGRYAKLAAKRSTEVTLTDLAGCLEEPQRGALVRKANDLRGLIGRVHEQTSTIKAATASLLAHMEGLMRHVGRQLSHTGTYSSRGFVEPGGVVVSALDLST